MLRDRFRRPRDLGIESLCLVCLSGPAAEQVFCGPITDGADQVDIEMVRGYLRECYSNGQIEQQFARMRTAAERLVRTSPVSKMRCWSAHTICEARRQRPVLDYFALA